MDASDRMLRCALGALGALLLLLPGAAVSAQTAGSQPEIVLEAHQLTARSWFFQGDAGMASAQNKGFMSNAGFVVTDEGVVVFDALGTPALGEAMVAAIRRVTSKPVRRVIVSHYHADHIYGLQALKAAGGEIWAHRLADQYFTSGLALERLAQRKRDLFPWVDEHTQLVRPDLWLEGDTDFRLGGVTFRILYSGAAHSPEDLLMFVVEERLLFAGDLLFAGRLPFVGNADSLGWLRAIETILPLKPLVVVPGHGPASRDVERDLLLTRDYLAYLRRTMGQAVAELDTFDDAYAKTDWARFKGLPAFEPANRINAYGTYLRMEQEALRERKP
jgi:glyoxylase-like metal-dependent hydrolase (beta-lactamase superfamily II)